MLQRLDGKAPLGRFTLLFSLPFGATIGHRPPFQTPSISLVMTLLASALRPLCVQCKGWSLRRAEGKVTVYPQPRCEREHASSREATQCDVPKGPPSFPHAIFQFDLATTVSGSKPVLHEACKYHDLLQISVIPPLPCFFSFLFWVAWGG
ncbi:hypothetical protein HDV64DRAFT_240468 [Trichoderma sp. TUCIM 5745]